MGVRRCAVLDENGVSLNTILVDERAIGHYHPGYGHKLVDLGPAVSCEPAKDHLLNCLGKIGLEPLIVSVNGKPINLETGDKLDLQTYEVTKKPVDVVVEEPPPKGKP
jgi:hypothetical protein